MYLLPVAFKETTVVSPKFSSVVTLEYLLSLNCVLVAAASICIPVSKTLNTLLATILELMVLSLAHISKIRL